MGGGVKKPTKPSYNFDIVWGGAPGNRLENYFSSRMLIILIKSKQYVWRSFLRKNRKAGGIVPVNKWWQEQDKSSDVEY